MQKIVYKRQSTGSVSKTFEFTEYDWIKAENQKSERVLLSEGYSEETVDIIKNYEEYFDNHIETLNTMSEETLKSFGYEDSDIYMIKNYKGTEAEIRGLGATCSISVTPSKFDSNGGSTYTTDKLSFSWEWNKIPMSQSNDLIAAGWNDFAITSKSCKVKYYDMTSGEYKRTVNATAKSPNSLSTGTTGAGYVIDLVDSAKNQFAKKGSGYYNLKSDVHTKKDCYYVIGYGHTQLSVSPNFSVSKSGLNISISLSSGVNLLDSKSGKVVPS